jgi:two-component system response regulator AtoC
MTVPEPSVLIVEDDEIIQLILHERLKEEAFRISAVDSLHGATRHLQRESVDVILLDNLLPDGSGLESLPRLKDLAPGAIFIMLTGHSSVEQAVLAMKAGAWHYACKPLDLEALVSLVHRAAEMKKLRSEVSQLRKVVGERFSFNALVGNSPQMEQTRAMLQKVARTKGATILLGGETGTGKDLAAQIIHNQSDRASEPFMNITCSALQESLLESELFGHEKGAFTDAKGQKKGLLEAADGGTVFLDEIGEMSLALQAKMLRFLEAKAFKRVGGTKDVSVDVRVIAATNRDLRAEVAAGRFREDLFYRLQVLPVLMPPLRDRPGDIRPLVAAFIERFARELHKPVRGVSDEALALLQAQHWPGNVRELRNAVERAVLLADAEMLTPDDFLMTVPRELAPVVATQTNTLPPGGVDLEKIIDGYVEQAMASTQGNQTQAAALLGWTRAQLRYRLEKLGLIGAS